MTKPWKGKIALDIREATPDWEPFIQPHAPEGSPNVLMIVWDDVGYGTMDTYGGPVETPNMTRIADSGIRFSNFHTTALCSPTRSCLLTGRNATSNNMACVTEAGGGFPGISARIPFENGTIRRSAQRAGLEHLRHRQVAPDPRRGDRPFVLEGALAAGPGIRAVLRIHGRGVQPVVPRPRVRQPPRRPAVPARGGIPPLQGPCRQGDRVHHGTRRRWPRTSPGSRTSAPDARHAPHHVFKEWADRYRAGSTWGTRRSGSRSLRSRRRWASCRSRRSSPHQPARGAFDNRAGRSALAGTRLRAALGLALGRRADALHPHGGSLCRVRLVHGPRDREDPRLSPGVRAAGEHDRHRRLR